MKTKPDNGSDYKNTLKKSDKLAVAIFSLGLIGTILGPFLFSRPWGWLDLTNMGEIGSAIGGMTAPFIGLMAGGLVYLSFRAQIQANKNQWDEIQRQKRMDHLQLLAQISHKYHVGLLNRLVGITEICNQVMQSENYNPTPKQIQADEKKHGQIVRLTKCTREEKISRIDDRIKSTYSFMNPMRETFSLSHKFSDDAFLYHLIHTYPFDDFIIVTMKLKTSFTKLRECIDLKFSSKRMVEMEVQLRLLYDNIVDNVFYKFDQ